MPDITNSLGSAITVLDTNVLLALYLFEDPAVASLRDALAARRLQPVSSSATDAEFAEVLNRPELFSVTPERQTRLLSAWQAAATLIDVGQSAPWVCRDPLDQKFLDLAVSASAAWLITRDRDLLKLARKTRRQGLIIVPPEAWSLVGLP